MTAAPIRAVLIGDDTATAVGLTVESPTPLLAICRALVDAGHDPAARLEAWRGDQLALTVRSIGEGAALTTNGKGNGFQHRKPAEAS